MFALSNRNYHHAPTFGTAVFIITAVSLTAFSCTRSGEPVLPAEKPAIEAQTQVVQLTTVTDHFQAPGTIRAKTQTILSSKVVGQIVSITVREGDRVRQGQVVAEVEGRDASAQLRRALAAVAEAQRALAEVDGAIRAVDAAVSAAEANRDFAMATQKRYEILRDRRSVSPQEFDEVSTRHKAAVADLERAQETVSATRARRPQLLARIEQAEAEEDAAQVAVGYLKIVSPINGVVTSRKAEPGILATPGTPLVAIEDDSVYRLESAVEESRVGAIRPGQSATVQIDALNATVDGRVSEVVPASDPATRTYTVKLDLTLTPAIRRDIHSGLFARTSFPAAQRRALVIPECAIVQRGQLTGVYTVRDGVAFLRLVKTGKRYDKAIEILSGLEEGTRIILSSRGELADNVKITEGPAEGTKP